MRWWATSWWRPSRQGRERRDAIEEGADYLVIGQRRFLLVEVDEATEEAYHATDPEEVALIREALRDNSPRLSGEAAREYLTEKAAVSIGKVDEQVRFLSAHIGWDITKGSKAKE